MKPLAQIYILIGLVSTCCSTTEDPRRFSTQEFAALHAEFERDCAVDTSHITSGFSELDWPVAGKCLYHEVEGKRYLEILIDPRWWVAASEDERKWLFYHELGHCALGLTHSDDPNDVMYSTVLPNSKVEHRHIATLCNKGETE